MISNIVQVVKVDSTGEAAMHTRAARIDLQDTGVKVGEFPWAQRHPGSYYFA